MATVVIFEKNGTRIMEGVDERDYRGRTDVAVNPEYPKGIPPHEWKLHDGKIVLPSFVEPPKLRFIDKLKNLFRRQR